MLAGIERFDEMGRSLACDMSRNGSLKRNSVGIGDCIAVCFADLLFDDIGTNFCLKSENDEREMIGNTAQ